MLSSLDWKGKERGKTLNHVIDSIEQTTPIRFFFLPEWTEGIRFGLDGSGQPFARALQELLAEHEMSFVEMYPGRVVILKDPTRDMQRQTAMEYAQREKKRINRMEFGSRDGVRKKSVVLTGRVTETKMGDPLVGATIQLSDSTSTTTNNDGRFRLSIAPGDYIMTVRYVNYDDMVIDIAAYSDGVVNAKLEEVPTVLDEIIVQDRAAREITQSRLGQVQINLVDMKRGPMLLGEADVVRQVQTLPGVTTVGEAAAGFNVRGGSVDQNLILYDGMPVFNASHAFGFLSAFNSYSIQDVSFYRGGIPAEYGGRASSVLDIRSKEGSYETWGGNVGIGIIASHAMVHGPLRRDKSSLSASIRSTYSDWLIHSVKSTYADLSRSKVQFFDGTIKYTENFSPKTKLAVTAYGSSDAFRLQGDSSYQWSNRMVTARLDHRISESISLDFTAGLSHYSYHVVNDNLNSAFDLSYRINTPVAKANLHFQIGRHRAMTGVQMQYYDFDPGWLKPGGNSTLSEKHMDRQKSFENAWYINDIYSVNDKLSIEGGLRIPVFTSIGITGRVSTNYAGWEPRGSIRYLLTPTSSIKGGFTRMYQFLHLISNTAAITPVDIWQPSNQSFKPQRADQVSLGYFKNFKQGKIETSVEGFYKYTANILDFRNGAKLILNDNLQRDLLRGNATAYGVETALNLVNSRLTGSVNYTYARSLRQVVGPTDQESINHGKVYPANFDQPNIVNVTWRYAISRRYYFTGNFTYHTGRPISIPLSGYYFEGTAVSNFSERNQYRIRDYHRLDIGFVMEGNHKRKKLGDGTWVLAFYNIYARRNPYSVFFKPSATGTLRPYQLSIIGTVLPSLSYNFTF